MTTGKFLAGGILGGIFYLLVLKGYLFIGNTSLSSYQNISGAFSGERAAVLGVLKKCVRQFLIYFFDFSFGIQWFPMLNVVMFASLIALVLFAMREKKIINEPWRFIVIILLIMLLPVCCYFCYVIGSEIEYHNLMVMGNSIIYLSFILFYERLETMPWRLAQIKQWGILTLSFAFIYYFIVIANISYAKMQMAYERSYGAVMSLAEDIRRMPGVMECKKLAAIGTFPQSATWSVSFPPEMTGITDGMIILRRDPSIEENAILSMLKDYCCLSYEDVSEEEMERIEQSAEFLKMESWPSESAIQIIDGICVVKLEGEWEKE